MPPVYIGSGGGISIGIRQNLYGAEQARQRLQTTSDALVKVPLVKAVHRMADVWAQNFQTEGAMVGGWAPLRGATQKKRYHRGYPPAHPILYRKGGLFKAAVVWPTRVTEAGGTMTYPTDADEGTASTTISVDFTNTSVTLRVTGPAVKNQFRQVSSWSPQALSEADPFGGWTEEGLGDVEVDVPRYTEPRRFWFVDNGVRRAIKQAVMQDLMERARGRR